MQITNDDVLTAPTPVIPVNLVGAMGKGLALAARTRWPELFGVYRTALRDQTLASPGLDRNGRQRPARLRIWRTGRQHVVLAPTKQHWRAPSPPDLVKATIDALGDALRAAGANEVNLPPIGCGLGGLAPELVYPWVAAAARAHPDLTWRLHRWPATIVRPN